MQPQYSTLYISPIGHSFEVQSIIEIAGNQLKRIVLSKNEQERQYNCPKS